MKYIHKKTGKEYELIQENVLYKDNGKWNKPSDLVIYKALYDNPDGPYFIRHADDFFENFEPVQTK